MKRLNHFVLCTTFGGQKLLIEKSRQRPRRAAYAFVVHEVKMLVITTSSKSASEKYFFPGGGLDLGEKPEDAAIREVREETGLIVGVRRRFAIVEYDGGYLPTNQGWRCIAFLFDCFAKTTDLAAWDAAKADEGEVPFWVPLAELSSASFQSVGNQFFDLWLDNVRGL